MIKTSIVSRFSDDSRTFSIPRVASAKAFGGMISSDGSIQAMMMQQVNKGKKAFYADYTIVHSKSVAMRKKLRHLASVVFSVILSSCYVWIMTQEVKQVLDTVENSFLTTMYPHRRKILKSGLLEKYINYRRRHVHVVRILLTKWKVDTVFECYCKRLFGFAYRNFAVSFHLCVELLRAAITYNNRQGWISLPRSKQQINNRPAEWKHAQAGKSRRRWEDMVVDWLGLDCFFRIAKIPRK